MFIAAVVDDYLVVWRRAKRGSGMMRSVSELEGEWAVIVVGNVDNDGNVDDEEVHFGHFFSFCWNFRLDPASGAGHDFLGVDLVESIDKGSMFGLGSTTIR